VDSARSREDERRTSKVPQLGQCLCMGAGRDRCSMFASKLCAHREAPRGPEHRQAFNSLLMNRKLPRLIILRPSANGGGSRLGTAAARAARHSRPPLVFCGCSAEFPNIAGSMNAQDGFSGTTRSCPGERGGLNRVRKFGKVRNQYIPTRGICRARENHRQEPVDTA
jgi:hypothetical protein